MRLAKLAPHSQHSPASEIEAGPIRATFWLWLATTINSKNQTRNLR